MDCALIRDELFAYHFGASTDDERDAIEEHLVACADCLRVYLALKRQIEAGSATEKPSADVRDRLRADVERRFRPNRSARVVAIFKRKMPVYQGIFAVALAACVTLAAPSVLRATRSATSAHNAENKTDSEPRVDSARHAAESLSIF